MIKYNKGEQKKRFLTKNMNCEKGSYNEND